MSHLITTRTKIAPEKLTDMPKLELCGAVLLANLMTSVRDSIPEIKKEDVYYYSDSADVLYWIWSLSLTQSKDSTNFVANRLHKIQKASSVEQWNHVDTKSNPADIACRGSSLSRLRDSDFWFAGPDFIREETIPSQTRIKRSVPEGVRREYEHATVLMASVVLLPSGLQALISLDSTNDYRRLIRVTDILLKAVRIWKRRTKEKSVGVGSRKPAKKSKTVDYASIPILPRKWRYRDMKSIGLMAVFGPPGDGEAELMWIRAIP